MNKRPTHTPGPWAHRRRFYCCGDQDYCYHDIGPNVDTGPGRVIATVDASCYSSDTDANVALIAAAPILLAALKEIMAHESRYLESVSYITAKAAIAEAEGQLPARKAPL